MGRLHSSASGQGTLPKLGRVVNIGEEGADERPDLLIVTTCLPCHHAEGFGAT